MKFETTIGLEIHVELNTNSKIFCSCSTKFGQLPNTNTCPVCIGLPGALPVLNEEVVKLAIKAGVALNCDINLINKTDRKNYFYPDLPKAYQISQFDKPICENGYIDIDNKRINLTRIHIEEDAGKLVHLEDKDVTLIDYNRAGVPLIEIVSEPDISSAEEAVSFLRTLRSILVYSGVSDCRMDQGSLRCDANISVRELGQEKLNSKVEIKNINSFKEVYKALKKEEKRQIELYSYGEGYKVVQETRRWDASKGKTITMRTKEDAHDYRYFPEPDIPPIVISDILVNEIKNTLPELPQAKKHRMIKEYNLTEKEAEVLIEEKNISDFYEEVVGICKEPKEAANWIITDIFRLIKLHGDIPVSANALSDLILELKKGTINRVVAKEILESICESDKTVKQIIEDKGLKQIDNIDDLNNIIDAIIDNNHQAVLDFKEGKKKSFGFLMGQIMKETKGKANPIKVRELLESKLK